MPVAVTRWYALPATETVLPRADVERGQVPPLAVAFAIAVIVIVSDVAIWWS